MRIRKGSVDSTPTVMTSDSVFQTMVDSLPIPIWSGNAQQGYTYFNRKWLNYTGRPLELQLGMGWVESVHPDDRPHCIKCFTTALDTPDPTQVEFRLRDQDDQYRWFLGRAAPLRDSRGAFCGTIGLCADISERVESEEHFREMTEALPLLVWTCRADGVCDYLSPQWLQFTGQKLQGPSDEALTLQFHPDDRREMFERWCFAVRQGVQYDAEFRLRRADGVYRWFKSRARPIMDKDRRVIKWFGSCFEVDDQKRLEKTLRESDKRLRLALTASKMGVWEWIPKTDEMNWSDECLAILDFGCIESTFDAFLTCVRSEDIDVIKQASAEALRTRAPYSAEFRTHSDCGETRWFHHQGQAEFDGSGNIERMLGTIREITADKIAAENLKASESRLRETFENLIVGCQIFDFDLRYVYLNANAAIHGRRSRDELLGMRLTEAYPAVESSELHQRLVRCLEKRTVERFDSRYVFADGSVGIFELSIQPVPEGALIVSADVTQGRQMAEKLVQSQKLEAVGRLAGGVAHDFNNLLTVIHGHCDLLQGTEAVLNTAPCNASVAAIRSAGERAARLTKQLLSFSRNAFVNAQSLDINASLEKSYDFIKSLCGEAIHFQLHLEPGLKSVTIDAVQFEQVILNLVLNARDAMPRGGKLTITTSSIQPEQNVENLPADKRDLQYIEVKVADTGIGMTPEICSRIFEPFFSTKDVGRGTGLGLPVVHGAVQQAGGHINLVSEPEIGTVFRLYYPCNSDDDADRPTESPAAALNQTRRILLVEDEDSVRTIVRISLELQGCEVIECSCASDALTLVDRDKAFHLLITDVVMPNMRGPELARTLRCAIPELRVLYISGYADASIGLKSALLPDDDFLQKPFSPVELARRVQSLLPTV